MLFDIKVFATLVSVPYPGREMVGIWIESRTIGSRSGAILDLVQALKLIRIQIPQCSNSIDLLYLSNSYPGPTQNSDHSLSEALREFLAGRRGGKIFKLF